MVNAGSSRPYDPDLNPPYQIEHSVEYSGKVVASSKRRVKFSFGFSSADAIESGATGELCRGPEHCVELVWSLTSGKRIVLADGREVHFSVGPRSGSDANKFAHSWTIPGGGDAEDRGPRRLDERQERAPRRLAAARPPDRRRVVLRPGRDPAARGEGEARSSPSGLVPDGSGRCPGRDRPPWLRSAGRRRPPRRELLRPPGLSAVPV